MAQPEDVSVTWTIQCFDRRRKSPLPVYKRYYVLDESLATDQQKQAVLAMIRASSPRLPPMEEGIGKTMVTYSFGTSGCTRAALQYRRLFRECSLEEIGALRDKGQRVETVSLAGEYFEDETGREITAVGMMDHVAGGPAIICGVPGSVTRFGPAEMVRADAWTTETANAFAHFFQLVRLIGNSAWYRADLTVTSTPERGVIDAVFPNVESMFGVLVLFRQLFSNDAQDNLFNRTCGAYSRHVGNRLKASWVAFEKRQFNHYLNSHPWPKLSRFGFRTSELLDMFLYGAGLVHSRGKDTEQQDKLRAVLEEHAREEVVFAFHTSMKMLFGPVVTVYPVLIQDFLHWTGPLGAARPDRLDITALFGADVKAQGT